MKKALWTLNITNEKTPAHFKEMLGLTFPLFKKFAHKIGADFNVITEPKIFGPHAGYEKFQLHKLGADYDWNILFDSDTLIHPDMFDPTDLLTKDTTASNGTDFTPQRFRSDFAFLRDGRFIGKGDWCAIFSNWCLDWFYYNPEELSIEEAMKRTFPLVMELTSPCGCNAVHLAEDYLVSHNIARFGLKHVLLEQLINKYGRTMNYVENQRQTPQGMQIMLGGPLFHQYLPTAEQKLALMKTQLAEWRISVQPIELKPEPSTDTVSRALMMDNGNGVGEYCGMAIAEAEK